jgi:tetratricopeptide (TPR) repeat protein
LFTASKNEAWRAVLRLQNELKGLEQLSPRAEALIWIQTARYYNRLQYFDDAERAFAKVEELLRQVPQYEQERGALAAGKGYIAQRHGRLEEAEDLYQLAFERFSAAQWQWGMQVQYANLAATACQRYEVTVLSDEATAFKHLDRALDWCLQGVSFMNEVGIGGLTDLETTLTFIYRMRRDWDEVRNWLDKARVLAESSDSAVELGLVYAEEAELHEALGDRVKAIAIFEHTQELFAAAQATEWNTLVAKRLNGLQYSDPNSRPLKIW